VEEALTGASDFAEREKDGFMGNFQYIAISPQPPHETPGSITLKLMLLRQYLCSAE
jgi:hypothetical protein